MLHSSNKSHENYSRSLSRYKVGDLIWWLVARHQYPTKVQWSIIMDPVNIQRVVLLTSLPFWLYSVTMLIADFNNTSMLMEGNYGHPEWQNFAIEETITERTIPVKKIIMVWKPIINQINSSVAVLSKSKKRRIREPTLPYNLMEESSRRSKRFATEICSLGTVTTWFVKYF